MKIELLNYNTYENLAFRVLNLRKYYFLESTSSPTFISIGFYDINFYGIVFLSNGFYNTGIHSFAFCDTIFRYAL